MSTFRTIAGPALIVGFAVLAVAMLMDPFDPSYSVWAALGLTRA